MTVHSKILTAGKAIAPAELAIIASDILRRVGMRAEQAEQMARVLVFSQESGIMSHGLAHLPVYIEGMIRGSINPRPKLFSRNSRAGVTVLDGDCGPGALVGKIASDEAMRLAAQVGVGVVPVRNSSHFGTASAFIYPMVQRGYVGLIMSNASPTVAPRGGRTALTGTNPIAAGFPRKDAPPVIIDMATTVGSRGVIRKAAASGQSIPIDWALDCEGQPTTDAEAALLGTMQALGGAKGTMLGLMIELLCVALSGGVTGLDTLPPQESSDRARGISHVFIAFDPNAFGSAGSVAQKVDEICLNLENTRPSDPLHPARLPGARAHGARQKARRDGIVLDELLCIALNKANSLTQGAAV